MTALADRLLMPFDERYEPARLAAIWNGRKTTRRPAAIVHARDASDVQAAVRLAAHNGWRVSIRSGGHSWVATGVRDDALLLDLSGMNEITLEVDNARATLQPAAQGVALNALLAQNGLAFPTGHCPSVGVGGFLLGGGYGWNSRKLGPACMSVDAIDVVLADGSLVHATDETHPDLMWAARGSGPGFFGVITRYYVRLHPGYDQVLRSVLVVPEEVRDEALAWSYDVLPETSRSLEIAAKVAYTPGVARPTTSLIAVGFCRDETPEQVFAAFENCPLRDKAITLVDRAPTSIAELYAFTEVGMPQGRRYAVDGVWTSATARDILQRGAPILDTVPNAESFLFWMLWGHYPQQPQACWSTQGELYFSPNSVWSDPAEDLSMEQWAHSSLAAFADIDLGTQFSDANPGDRPAKGIEPEPAARIDRLRQHYDPDSRFASYLQPSESTTALGQHLRAAGQ
jgi:FAD/FMN-containing dehydrogenase